MTLILCSASGFNRRDFPSFLSLSLFFFFFFLVPRQKEALYKTNEESVARGSFQFARARVQIIPAFLSVPASPSVEKGHAGGGGNTYNPVGLRRMLPMGYIRIDTRGDLPRETVREKKNTE